MLVVHSSSRCDVCLSEYSWETAGKRPHAISCGHIFCRDCLYANTPPLCPLCRHVYQPNKMKRLHVDRPEDIDDHKETDLLQRLVVSWDTPPEQLREIVSEVDTWLMGRSEDACVALRKGRAALDQAKHLKKAETDLVDTVHRLHDELERLHSSFVREQTTSMAVSSQYASQVESMAKEIRDLKSQNSRFQGRFNHPYNPLPAPPQPVSTPNLPTLEQALSESASGVRVMELPSSPAAPYPFEVENRRSRKRRTNSKELRYTYDDKGYQQSPSSHYVQPHITTHHEPSPSRLAHHYENTAQPVDAYALLEASVREYSTGFLSGAEAALGIGSRRREPTSQLFSPARHGLQTVQSASAFEPVDNYRPISANIYRHQPYSAPVPRESSPQRTHRRQSTAESSIRNTSSSRSSPRSRDERRSTASSHYTNPLLASILSDDVAHSRRSNGVASPSPHPPRSRTTAPLQPQIAPNSPSARSRMTLDSGSWGTAPPSDLTGGSLIPGLSFFRSGAQAVFEDGHEFRGFRRLDSDGNSIRTRQASLSDLASEDATSHVSRSPARHVHDMVGVLPDEARDRSARSSRDDLHALATFRPPHSADAPSSRHAQSSRDPNAHSNRSSRVYSYEQVDDRAAPHDNRSSGGRSTGSQHERYAREPPAVAAHPSVASLDARPVWENGYAPLETNPRAWVSGAADDDAGHARSRRAERALLRDSRGLPTAESPASGAADYLHGYRPSPRAALTVGQVDAHVPASFNGNALGLELSAGPSPISAPIPRTPQTFLQSWSQDH